MIGTAGVVLVFGMFSVFFPVLGQQFEGIVSIRISTPSFETDEMESFTQRFYLKGPYMRLEVEGDMSDIVVLVDNSKREIYTLDFALRRYTSNTFDEYAEEDDYGAVPMEFDMRKTNQRRTILGYEAELIEFIARGDTRESFDRIAVWATPQLGSLFAELMTGFMVNDSARYTWQRVLIEHQLFPLETATYIGQSVLEKTEVVRIERRPVAETLFVIPPDFRKVDLRR